MKSHRPSLIINAAFDGCWQQSRCAIFNFQDESVKRKVRAVEFQSISKGQEVKGRPCQTNVYEKSAIATEKIDGIPCPLYIQIERMQKTLLSSEKSLK